MTRSNFQLIYFPLGNSEVPQTDTNKEKSRLTRGFIWGNQSCSYDSLLTSLLFMYSNDNELGRNLLKSTIPGLAAAFDDLLNENTDPGLIKNNLLNEFFFGPGSMLKPGVHQSIDKIYTHIMGFCKIQIQNDVNDQYFQLNYDLHKTCNNQECVHKNDEKIISAIKNDILFFDPMKCTDSINSKIDEFLHSKVRHYRCEECGEYLQELYVTTSVPHILTIHLTPLDFSYPIDEEVEVGGQIYELKSVIYFSDAHFICRFNHDKCVYEYDGYARKGLIHEIKEVNPFRFMIKDTSNNHRRAYTIFYRKKQN